MENWHFPVFVKPAKGSASIGAKKCNSIKEIEDFISLEDHILLHAKEAVVDYIVQEFLSGPEYVVDTVSLAGKHQIVSILCYEKISFKGYPVYRSMIVVDPDKKEWKICADYVLKVLDAIELKNGFGHTELILGDSGPALIEVNPGISGGAGFVNKLAECTLKTCQPDVLIKNIFSEIHDSSPKMLNNGKVFSCKTGNPGF